MKTWGNMLITSYESRVRIVTQQEKPALVRDSIQKKIETEVTCTLSSDFDRFSAGDMMMSLTTASFDARGVEGKLHVDMGGTVVEVVIGSRHWAVNLKDVIQAALEADILYRADIRKTEEEVTPGFADPAGRA